MRKVVLLPLFLVLCACASGIGRAASLAVSGVPPTVAQSIDSLEKEYDRLSGMEMAGVTKNKATKPDRIVLQQAAIADRQGRIDATHKLFADLRQYVGVEKGAAPEATQDAAAKQRAELLNGLLDKFKQADIEEKAAKVADDPKKDGE